MISFLVIKAFYVGIYMQNGKLNTVAVYYPQTKFRTNQGENMGRANQAAFCEFCKQKKKIVQ